MHIAAAHLLPAGTEAHHHHLHGTDPRHHQDVDPHPEDTVADPNIVILAIETEMCIDRVRIHDLDLDLILHDRGVQLHREEEVGGDTGPRIARPVGEEGDGVQAIRVIRVIVIEAGVGTGLGGGMDGIGRGGEGSQVDRKWFPLPIWLKSGAFEGRERIRFKKPCSSTNMRGKLDSKICTTHVLWLCY